MARGPGFISLALAAAWLAVVLAGEASAASVKEVRLGLHADYSRLVIELDHPAGYRLQHDAAQGVFTLSLDASAQPKTLSLASGAVASVQVEPGPQGARASIRLRDKRARAQEHIYTNPPRIVLDFRSPAASAAATPKGAAPARPTAKATPKPSAPPAPKPASAAAPPAPAAGSAMREPLPKAPAEARPEVAPEAAPPPPAAEAAAEAPPEARRVMGGTQVKANPVPPPEPRPLAAQGEGEASQLWILARALFFGAAGGILLAMLVLWLAPRLRRARPSPESMAELFEVEDTPEEAAPERAEPIQEREPKPPAKPRAPVLKSPPPGLRDDAPVGTRSAAERVRGMEERDEGTPASDAPKSGTTMTSMTRER